MAKANRRGPQRERAIRGPHDWNDAYAAFAAQHAEILQSFPEPVFCLPLRLWGCLLKELPKWLAPDEVAFEKAFIQICEAQAAMGAWNGGPIRRSGLAPTSAAMIPDHALQETDWDQIDSVPEILESLQRAAEIERALRERQRSYAGWLITTPQFLGERDDLRKNWGDLITQIGALPVEPIEEWARSPSVHFPADSEVRVPRLVDDFSQFYQRWRIRQLIGWEFPEPLGTNIGGPAAWARPMGTSSIAVVQSPPTVRLPARDARRSLNKPGPAQLSDHLQEWQQIQDERHPSGFSYTTFERILEFRFYRDLVLGGRYGDRFTGNVRRLDSAFSRYFEVSDDRVLEVRKYIGKQFGDK